MIEGVFDYPALLEALPSGSLAWLANRLTGAEQGATWPSRERAIAAILDAHERLDDDDPNAELLRRFCHAPVPPGGQMPTTRSDAGATS